MTLKKTMCAEQGKVHNSVYLPCQQPISCYHHMFAQTVLKNHHNLQESETEYQIITVTH